MSIFRVHIIVPEFPRSRREHISREEARRPQEAFRKAMKKFMPLDSPGHGHHPCAWVVMIERMKQDDEVEV